jgi:integrase
MASISRDSKGWTRIRIAWDDDRRTSLPLGHVTKRMAQHVLMRVEAIVSARKMGCPVDAETSTWIGERDDRMYAKLVKAGLAELRTEAQAPAKKTTTAENLTTTLENLRKDFGASKLKAKVATRTHWDHTWRNLEEFFGKLTDIAAITEADAETWAEWLEVAPSVRPVRADGTKSSPGQELSLATARKRCCNAKQFFKFAVKKRLIPASPFADINSNGVDNRTRDFFITPEAAAMVIGSCPDAERRLIFALSRYGGLRCPSETLSLRWDNVDWQQSRMCVTSPKTEHHPGHESRIVPIFPELKPFLDEAWENAADGAEFVVAAHRETEANLRTQFMRIIVRAGLEPWPKIFHNLRSTRQTELEESFPTHVVCTWLGNSPRIARKNYLQVTEAHFAKAQDSEPEKLATRLASQCRIEASDGCQEMTEGPRRNEKTPANTGASRDFGRIVVNSQKPANGRDRTRTCDLHDVNVAI